MKNYKELANNDVEFQKIIEPLIKNETVQQMKNYRQHYDTTCFEHCYMASYHCYSICKKYNLDYKSATRAAMLHDLFLYDWRKRQPDRKGLHAFTHGKTALKYKTAYDGKYYPATVITQVKFNCDQESIIVDFSMYDTKKIVEEISKEAGMNTKAHALSFVLPVEDAIGMAEIFKNDETSD